MDFITQTETFYQRKLRKAGERVSSDEKLDEMYPKIFKKAGGALKAKAETKADNKTEEKQ